MSLLQCKEKELAKDLDLNQDYSFIFETLPANKEIVYASKPSKVFHSLDDLNNFIKTNHQELSSSNAGFAGYLGFEGQIEFAFYDEIKKESISDADLDNLFAELIDSSKQNSAAKILVKEPPKENYIKQIKKCQEYIAEGDIYQANITRKYSAQLADNISEDADCKHRALEIYSKLRKNNPAPYSGFMNFAKYQIMSSSPESFLKIYKPKSQETKLKISTSPIKGTADLANLDFLKNSHKDKAEHIMIVDLERNDLGRIAETGSVTVDEMLGIYKFTNLYHYISTISADLKKELYKDGLAIKDIFAATFPGGSITGAPKIRALEIIKELESVERGPYTGAMGYLRYQDGFLQGEFNILIRSFYIDKKTNTLFFHTGGGITAYSDPCAELAEAKLKAEKMIESLR